MLPADTILRSRYKIITLLGKGGFGETYLAEDLDIPTNPKPKRVVKLLSPQNRNPQVLQLAKDLFDRDHQLPEDSSTGEVIWRQWANVGDRVAGVLTNMVRSNH
ncbi:hypothetical protein [Fischerella sp.]|jgi:serine/threonine protein kinase|uniref:hypothetical protein n=1 Tax=Fischerella sp. TaxID=1191 RepID=UPI0025B85777|nr:hypothetical protein [Fischerella sp.]